MDTPQAAPPPPQLSSESAKVENINQTQPCICDVEMVRPIVMKSLTMSLESEFHSILTRITTTTSGRETDHTYAEISSMTNTTFSTDDLVEAAETTAKNREAINDLRRIANRMRSYGHVSWCIRAYKTVRMNFLYTSLAFFGIEKPSSTDIRSLFSDELEERIERCVRACNASFGLLFPAEMELCLRIFEGEERSVCYSETIQESVAQLFDYAGCVINARRLPEMFKYLDLHAALLNLSSAPSQWEHIISDLVEKIRCTLSDFEKLVINELSDSTTSEVESGIVSLTKYVMHYLTRMSEYKGVLTGLIVSKPASTDGLDKNIPDVEYTQAVDFTPLELHVVYIVVLLRFKIEKKSKQYYKADSTESYLFLVNNLAHIVQAIRQSYELEDLIGIPYMYKLMDNYLKQAMMKYQRKTCDNMLGCLRNNYALRCFPGVHSISITTFMRKLAPFYVMFEETRLNQARWTEVLVTDQELFVPVEEELVDAYTTFLERFSAIKDGQNVFDYLVKYSPLQIQTLINKDFFRTSPLCNLPFHL